MPKRDRRGAEKRGRHAETLAAMWLRLKGYSVLETRLRLPVGEIDIIARRGAVIAFIEVKQRAQHDTAKHAVSHASWHRISRAAEVWLARHPDYRRLNWRYDLITVAPRSLPKHAPDYWRP